MSDSGRKAVPDNFTTADDRRAKEKTRTPFQSPAGQQPPKKDKAKSSPTIATKKATEDASAVVHGVNSQQQQNRVPDPSSQDPTTVTKTGHVARTTDQNAQSRASSSNPAQSVGLVAHDSTKAQSKSALTTPMNTVQDDKQVSIEDAMNQIDTNTNILGRLHVLEGKTQSLSHDGHQQPKTTKNRMGIFRSGATLSDGFRGVKARATNTFNSTLKFVQARRSGKKAESITKAYSDESIQPRVLGAAYTPPDEETINTSHGDAGDKPLSPTGKDSLMTVTSIESHDGNVVISPKQDPIHTESTPPKTQDTYDDGKAHIISQQGGENDPNQDKDDLQTALRLSTGSIDIDENGNITSPKSNVNAHNAESSKPETRDPNELTDDELYIRRQVHRMVVDSDRGADYVFKHDPKSLPPYTRLLNFCISKERVDISDEKRTALIQFSGFHPSGELIPKATSALKSMLRKESHFLVDKAWAKGGGIVLEWSSLWGYRTIHAQAVVKWCEHNVELMLRASFGDITYGDQVILHMAASAMAIADFPLLLQDIIRYQFEKRQLRVSKTMSIDKAIKMTLMVCGKAYAGHFMKVAQDAWRADKSPFVQQYQDPPLELPKPRFLHREDPLQFVDKPPPDGKSHFHGRWVAFQNHGPAWMEYADTSGVHRWAILPPNVSRIHHTG